MKINLLKKEYISSEAFYEDFLNDEIKNKEEYFSGEAVFIDEAPDFPIYISTRDEE